MQSIATSTLPTGVSLFHTMTGPIAGDVVVFVNGLTMDTTSWNLLLRELPQVRAVCYDCRGQGKSDKPAGPYTPQQHSDDLIALLDKLELPQIHLVGLSNGGLIAMLTAGRLADTERIKSVITIDSLLSVDPILRVILRSWKAALLSGGPGLRFDVATPWVWGHSFLNAHLDEVLAFRDLAASADPEAVVNLIGGAEGFDTARETWQRYEGPSLAIVGREDVLTPPRYSEEIVQYAKNGRLEVLQSAGHAAPVERPVAVAALLRDFLGKLS